MKKLAVVLAVLLLWGIVMASLIERDHYINDLFDRIEALENMVEEITRAGLISDGAMVIGEGNVRVDTEGIALVDDGHASVTKVKWKDESFLGETLGDILVDWSQVASEDVVTWIRAFEHPDQSSGEAQIILKVDNKAQTDDTRLTLQSADHKIVFGGVDLFEIRDDAGDTLYFSADDIEGIIADGVQMKDGLIRTGSLPGCKAKVASFEIANASVTKFNFTTADEWDDAAYHSTSVNPSRITIPSDYGGRYLITGYAIALSNNNPARVYWILYKNNVAMAQSRIEMGGALSFTQANTITYAEELAATDYVELAIYQDSGGAIDYYGDLAVTRIGD